jgi:hypothetical protein
MRSSSRARLCRAFLLVVAVVFTAGAARAFSGKINYTGDLGPIGNQRPLCICVYKTPELTQASGASSLYRNNETYDTGELTDRDYYVIGFVDLHINERRDADEPYVIFDQRAGTPGDPINGLSTRTDLDLIFGDENLVEQPTASPSATPTITSTPADTPTAESAPTAPDTPTPSETPAVTPTGTGRRRGRLRRRRHVTVDELVRAVGVALDAQPLSSCASADRDSDGTVRIDELIAAINTALAA